MGKLQERIALYPGTFDPITSGHLDIIRRGVTLFDKLIVGIGHNPKKEVLFPPEEREAMIRTLADAEGLEIEIAIYQGLTVDFAKAQNAAVILRGIRNSTDIQFETQLALTNRALGDIETVLIVAGQEHGYTSSSLIKQIAAGGKVDRLSKLLPDLVIEKLREKLAKGEEVADRMLGDAVAGDD